jgi:hypothetical protein
VQASKITNDESIDAWVEELMEVEEARFLVYFHQIVDKSQKKAWHDWHIKHKSFSQGDQVMLYNRKYEKHQGKLHIHWLGYFIVA